MLHTTFKRIYIKLFYILSVNFFYKLRGKLSSPIFPFFRVAYIYSKSCASKCHIEKSSVIIIIISIIIFFKGFHRNLKMLYHSFIPPMFIIRTNNIYPIKLKTLRLMCCHQTNLFRDYRFRVFFYKNIMLFK